jgi:hypothetical protein
MKSIFTSKTFWFNFLTAIAAASKAIPMNQYTLAASAIINILLRTVTTLPVSIPLMPPLLTPDKTIKVQLLNPQPTQPTSQTSNIQGVQ